MARLFSLGLMLGTTFWLMACATVEVDSSSAGKQSLANARTYYLNPEFPETDDAKLVSEGWQNKVRQAITDTLAQKGYAEADSPAQADFTLNGSWEKGKILGKKQPTNYNGDRDQAKGKDARYLTLSAVQADATQWSAQAPIVDLPDDITELLASFPERDGQ